MNIQSMKDVRRLTDLDLVSAIIGTNPNDKNQKKIAYEVLKIIKEKGSQMNPVDLNGIYGVKDKRALKVMACCEISRRYFPTNEPISKITRPEDTLPLFADIRTKKQEYFCVLTLNGAGEVLENRVVTIGLLNHSLVHPREVYADAIADRAASIICVHNHPSGSLEPSSQDIAITTQLKEAGSILGISLIDHLIITKTGHISLRERGLV